MGLRNFLFKLGMLLQCIGVTYWLGKFALEVFTTSLGQLTIFGVIGAVLSLVIIIVDWILTAVALLLG